MAKDPKKSGVWMPPSGASKPEPQSIDFWKPKRKGDAIVGHVTSITKNAYGEALVIEPAVLFNREEEPQGFGSMKVSINSWLQKLVGQRTINQNVGIRYLGQKSTPQGQMRTFDVFELSADDWQETMEKYAPGLKEATQGGGDAAEEDGDDLPF